MVDYKMGCFQSKHKKVLSAPKKSVKKLPVDVNKKKSNRFNMSSNISDKGCASCQGTY